MERRQRSAPRPLRALDAQSQRSGHTPPDGEAVAREVTRAATRAGGGHEQPRRSRVRLAAAHRVAGPAEQGRDGAAWTHESFPLESTSSHPHSHPIHAAFWDRSQGFRLRWGSPRNALASCKRGDRAPTPCAASRDEPCRQERVGDHLRSQERPSNPRGAAVPGERDDLDHVGDRLPRPLGALAEARSARMGL